MRFSFADGLFWSSVACCAYAQLHILRSVRGHRFVAAAPATSATLPRRSDAMELVWAVAPAVALAVLLLFTWRAMHPAAPVAPVPASAAALAR